MEENKTRETFRVRQGRINHRWRVAVKITQLFCSYSRLLLCCCCAYYRISDRTFCRLPRVNGRPNKGIENDPTSSFLIPFNTCPVADVSIIRNHKGPWGRLYLFAGVQLFLLFPSLLIRWKPWRWIAWSLAADDAQPVCFISTCLRDEDVGGDTQNFIPIFPDGNFCWRVASVDVCNSCSIICASCTT